MSLAIFDLDHTLIDTDSDHAWGEFLVEKGAVDTDTFLAANQRFYEQYHQGTLDIDEYLTFALKPLADNPAAQVHQWREEFINTRILQTIKPGVAPLLKKHREAGDDLLVITATNRFIVEDIVIRHLGIDNLLATPAEYIDGRYTGRYLGVPTFREGKVTNFYDWLAHHPQHSLEDSWFYSDSHNDLPLMELVGHPVAVDADKILTQTAQEKGWPVISLL